LDWCKQRSQAVADEARKKKKKQRKKAIYGIWNWERRRVSTKQIDKGKWEEGDLYIEEQKKVTMYI